MDYKKGFMKNIVVLSCIGLAVILANESKFATDKQGKEVTRPLFPISYSLYSVNPDKVSVWGLPLSLASYCTNLRVDITGDQYMNNEIEATESISTWISSNPSGTNTMGFYCNQSDADDVCMVKIAHIDILDLGVCEYVAGDVDTSIF
jgi:hypothetical protein